MIMSMNMNKKLLALLLIPLMLLLYGCSGSSHLTKEEYVKAVDKAWDEYRDGYGRFIKIAASAGDDFSKMKEKSDQLSSACEKMDKALEKFEGLNPPSEFEDLHQKLLKSIEDEKRWQEYRKKGYSAETEEEANTYFQKISEEVNAAESGSTLSAIYLEIHKKGNNS